MNGVDHTDHDPLEDTGERVLISRVIAGILGGMVFFTIISVALIRFTASGWGWASSLAIGGFAGFWAGLFFGAAAGNAWHIVKSGDH